MSWTAFAILAVFIVGRECRMTIAMMRLVKIPVFILLSPTLIFARVLICWGWDHRWTIHWEKVDQNGEESKKAKDSCRWNEYANTFRHSINHFGCYGIKPHWQSVLILWIIFKVILFCKMRSDLQYKTKPRQDKTERNKTISDGGITVDFSIIKVHTFNWSSNSWGSSNTWGSSNSSCWDHRIVGDHRIPLDL